MTEFDQLADDVLDQEAKESRLMKLLLDKQSQKKDHVLALQVRMGTTRSFVTSLPLEWVAQKVRFASELPLFSGHLDANKKVVLDVNTVSLVQQRAPDPRRQFPMTTYLAKRRHHKFPPLLLVVSQSWVDDEKSDSWSDKRAIRDSVTVQPLDNTGNVFDLRVSADDFVYALDGQHRLMAIQGLHELLSKGKLFARNSEGKQTDREVTLESILESIGGAMTMAGIQQLLSERIGIEIISAVQKGETREQALRRIRSIFVHVNRHAVALTKGEIALLNEDDGFAVTSRDLMVTHALLKGRVQLKKGQLPATSEDITTLETLVEIARKYLGQFPKFKAWEPDAKDELAIRPEEDSLVDGTRALNDLYTAHERLPVFQAILLGKKVSEARAETEHLLLRPSGQLALAEALGELIGSGDRKLESLFQVLAEKERENLLSIKNEKAPWYGVLYDPLKNVMQRHASAQKLAARLFRHLLGGGTPEDAARLELQEAFAKARAIDATLTKATDLQGKVVSLDKVMLPVPWI